MEGDNGGTPEVSNYVQGKQLLSYIQDKKSDENASVNADDYNIIKVKLRDYYTLGSLVSMDGENMYVYSAESRYSSSIHSESDVANADEFWHMYQLVPAKRFFVSRMFNQNLAGVSLSATVESVEKSTVKVKCDIDKDSSQMVERPTRNGASFNSVCFAPVWNWVSVKTCIPAQATTDYLFCPKMHP